MTNADLVTALEETWAGVNDVIAGIDAEQWQLPTPCEGWTVHDLVAHLGAIESQVQGLPQPDIEVPPPTAGIDAWTEAGVAPRRGWTTEAVVDEVAAASSAQLAHLRALDDEGWGTTRSGPVGDTTEAGLAAIRLLDVWLHLLDLRSALGLPLEPEREPTACRLCVDRAVELAGWGATKKAGLPDGSRVRLALKHPGKARADVVVADGRGSVVPSSGEGGPTVIGTGIAFLLVVAGRPYMANATGGVRAEGDAARLLLKGYRIFS